MTFLPILGFSELYLNEICVQWMTGAICSAK